MIHSHEIIKRFVEHWNRNERLVKASVGEVDQVEAKLGISLPLSYKYLVSEYGDLYTPDLLDVIVDKNLDLPDVQNFALPEQALEDTEAYVKAGMPSGYFGFASDCMGNLFCLKLDEGTEPEDDCSVWFFDHDFVDMRKLSDSFITWLETYVQIAEKYR